MEIKNHLASDSYRILVADDDQKILAVYDETFVSKNLSKDETDLNLLASELFNTEKEITSNKSFDLTLCQQGEEAVNAVKRSLSENKPYSVAFLDVRMPPGLNGVEAAQQIREIDPHIEIIIVTAYTDTTPENIAKKVMPLHKLLYLQKPFNPLEIYHFATSLSSKWLTEILFFQKHKELEDSFLKLEQTKLLLEKSEFKFRNLVESTKDWIWEADAKGFYTYSSPVVCDILGYTPDEMIGRTRFDFMPADEAVKIKKIITDTIEKALPINSLENINIHKDGQYITLETSGNPIFDETEKIIGYRGVDRDITERKKIQTALKDSQKQKEKLISELQKALENIETLSGLIPICSSCKKIRDDEGYWNILESYIQKHSNAQFSHSICPECSDKLYGDEDWYIDMTKDK